MLLERPDGTQDPVNSDEIAELLYRARSRLKLVILSSCQSAAITIEETLRWLGIWKAELLPDVSASETDPGDPLPGLAQQLVHDLDCGVLAMRYPVDDEFAIHLDRGLYEQLLGKEQPLSRALQLALPEALGIGHADAPPISVATPALFGKKAVGLCLRPPPEETISFDVPTTGMAGFEEEPSRFVGQIGPMVQASAALAPESGKTGVLFYGMAGAGKSSCALELAYHHSRSKRFRAFVWYKAPDEYKEIDGELMSLAIIMEDQLPGLKMVDKVGRSAEFAAWLPRLKELLEQRSVLIVMDNLESLLTSSGEWRDERWGLLVNALLTHHGHSRTVLTSRRIPAGIDQNNVPLEPIHALSLSEAAILAREMGNLGRLLSGESPAGIERGRKLVARTLALVQGHPKLIELAEGQADEPDMLDKHLERVAETWVGGRDQLGDFFEDGESSYDAKVFLEVLKGWTKIISGTLETGPRTLFHFLCGLEDSDRLSSILEPVWPNLWRRLEMQGEVPDLAISLEPLNSVGLVEVQPQGKEGFRYSVHPVVAGSACQEFEDEFQAAVDAELSDFWVSRFSSGLDKELEGGGALVGFAGVRVIPYLLRLERWDFAAGILEKVIFRSNSPRTAEVVLPVMRRIAEETEGSEQGLINLGRLAKTLSKAYRFEEAEAIFRSQIQNLVDLEGFIGASSVAGDLSNILIIFSKLEDALVMAEEAKIYSRRAGLGPWSQLQDEGRILQIQVLMGKYKDVLEKSDGLIERMRALTDKRDQKEITEPWQTREFILNVFVHVALL